MKHPPRHIPRVIAVVSMKSNYGPSVLRGIFAHVAAHGEWGLEIIRTPEDFASNTVVGAIEHKTDGIIIAAANVSANTYEALAKSRIPVVLVETYSDFPAAHKNAIRHVHVDNEGIGRDAARNFLKQGRYLAFGYVPPPAESHWSVMRYGGFARQLAHSGRTVSVLPRPQQPNAIERRGNIAKWLRRLGKPVAILAADDAVAAEVIQACQSVRLNIPNDVAVLGVDDEPLLCENIRPSISSIRPAFVDAGYKAADILEGLMRKKTGPTDAQAVLVHGKNEITVRESTKPESSAGLLVQRAISFIEENSSRGIGISDIREYLGVSRALMDLRFREVCGKTVLTVLTEARLKELKRALTTTDEPIAEITERLGWTSPNYPKNLFKKQCGCTMFAWRKSHRK